MRNIARLKEVEEREAENGEEEESWAGEATKHKQEKPQEKILT